MHLFFLAVSCSSVKDYFNPRLPALPVGTADQMAMEFVHWQFVAVIPRTDLEERFVRIRQPILPATLADVRHVSGLRHPVARVVGTDDVFGRVGVAVVVRVAAHTQVRHDDDRDV